MLLKKNIIILLYMSLLLLWLLLQAQLLQWQVLCKYDWLVNQNELHNAQYDLCFKHPPIFIFPEGIRIDVFIAIDKLFWFYIQLQADVVQGRKQFKFSTDSLEWFQQPHRILRDPFANRWSLQHYLHSVRNTNFTDKHAVTYNISINKLWIVI